jgi:hypothetical protein
MAKSNNKSNTPRRKRYNRSARLQNAKKWAQEYNGKNIAKGYSNWFGVDLMCAITELELLGYKFKESYKKQVNQSIIARQKDKERRKLEKEQKQYDEHDGFFYIEGYTAGGFPYGIMREDLEETDMSLPKQLDRKESGVFLDDEELPF